MPRTCTICIHPKRAEIELSVTNGAAFRTIAKQHDIGYVSIQRHMAEHIKQAAKEQQAKRNEAKALDVLAQLRAINATTLRILHETQANPKTYGLALQAIDRVQKQIELQAKLLGDLDTNINIALSPEWLVLQAHILKALSSYPEARLAVAEALDRAQLN